MAWAEIYFGYWLLICGSLACNRIEFNGIKIGWSMISLPFLKMMSYGLIAY
jgi:hypothetical protein